MINDADLNRSNTYSFYQKLIFALQFSSVLK